MGDDNTSGSIINETLNRLRAAPDNDITDLAWLAWFLSSAEQTFHAKTEYTGGQEAGTDWGGKYLHPASKLRANYVNQINKLTSAAAWADTVASGLLPTSSQLQVSDIDLDGENEAVLFNDQVWCLFENDGGRLEYAFSWSDTCGPVQLIAPTHQHQLIFDGLDRNFESGEISALPTWDRAVDGCFVENFSYPVYTMSILSDQLMMTSPDEAIQKTFSLDGSRVHADYVLDGISQVNPGFGFTVNLMNTYNPNWSDLYQKIEQGDLYGWRCTAGGQVTVDLSDPNTALASMDAFSDSPADEEMQERLSYDDYPNGHWFNFPYHTISTIGINDFRITLSLTTDPNTSVEVSNRTPGNFRLFEAFPNPFNSATRIRYHLIEPDFVILRIYDLHGREVETLVHEFQAFGEYEIIWHAKDCSNDIYFYRLQVGGLSETGKVILLK